MDAKELAEKLGAKRSGRQYVCKCIAHEDSSPSMIIFDGRSEVQIRCLAGCTQAELINALIARGHWRRPEAPVLTHIPLSVPMPAPHVEGDRHRKLARHLFERSTACNGTIAQEYFESREIWTVARRIEDIRYCHDCPRGIEKQPAVVVAMRNVATRAITAVQRIYLIVKAGKVLKDGAQMLGVASGAAMMLQTARVEGLHICEGLETGCALIAMDHAPVWAMGSASLIAAMPVLPDVKRLVIWADHDKVNPMTGQRAGERAALVCRSRWLNEGHMVLVKRPAVEGFDALDVWRQRLAAQ